MLRPTKRLQCVLNNPNCYGLFSKNPGIAKDILNKYQGVVNVSGPPSPNISATEAAARQELANKGAVVVTPASLIQMPDGFKVWTGKPFTTYAGPLFYDPSAYGSTQQQLTILIHELLHIANPNLPPTKAESKAHNDKIRTNCNTK